MAYTERQNRRQVPELYISELRGSAPVYFSCPLERSATLTVSPDIEGRFALAYAGGQLTELIDKKKGEKKSVAVFAGNVSLIFMDGSRRTTVERFHIAEGEQLTLKDAIETEPPDAVGERRRTLFAKGLPEDHKVVMTKKRKGLSLLAGADYAFGSATNGVLFARHSVGLPVRFDYSHFTAALRMGAAFDGRDYPVWGYEAKGVAAAVRAGGSLDAGKTRFTLCADLALAHLWQRFDSGDTVKRMSLSPAVHLAVLLPRDQRLIAEFFVRGGAVWGEGESAAPTEHWGAAVSAGMTFFVRLL